MPPARSDSVKRGGSMVAGKIMGMIRGGVYKKGRADHFVRSGFAMLNVPTLWMVFVTNFLALGLVWAYVMHSYPKFETARYWAFATATAAVGAAISMFRGEGAPELPLLLSAACLLTAGRFA